MGYATHSTSPNFSLLLDAQNFLNKTNVTVVVHADRANSLFQGPVFHFMGKTIFHFFPRWFSLHFKNNFLSTFFTCTCYSLTKQAAPGGHSQHLLQIFILHLACKGLMNICWLENKDAQSGPRTVWEQTSLYSQKAILQASESHQNTGLPTAPRTFPAQKCYFFCNTMMLWFTLTSIQIIILPFFGVLEGSLVSPNIMSFGRSPS